MSAFANMNSFHIAMRLIDISACYMPCCWMIPCNVLNRISRTRVNFKWKQYCAAFFCKHSTKSNIWIARINWLKMVPRLFKEEWKSLSACAAFGTERFAEKSGGVNGVDTFTEHKHRRFEPIEWCIRIKRLEKQPLSFPVGTLWGITPNLNEIERFSISKSLRIYRMVVTDAKPSLVSRKNTQIWTNKWKGHSMAKLSKYLIPFIFSGMSSVCIHSPVMKLVHES